MKEVFGKLDTYEILTNLFPGVFFGLGLNFLLDFQLPTGGVINDIFAYYFLGLIVGRFGSVVVEPCLEKLRLIRYSPYLAFLKAEKCDAKIPSLLTASNYFRSLLAGVLLFPVVWCLKFLALRWDWFGLHWKAVLVLALVLLLFASYKKQIGFIRARVEAQSSTELD